ncbi:uncharacterized protein [Rutidosis leptorrhynchoides]|uniref:uncharacterized protein isoform X2 n=1 Tax=Rutidosis leptorrhynchoides TaxID=125765 RepID=UPI003A9A4FE8
MTVKKMFQRRRILCLPNVFRMKIAKNWSITASLYDQLPNDIGPHPRPNAENEIQQLFRPLSEIIPYQHTVISNNLSFNPISKLIETPPCSIPIKKAKCLRIPADLYSLPVFSNRSIVNVINLDGSSYQWKFIAEGNKKKKVCYFSWMELLSTKK